LAAPADFVRSRDKRESARLDRELLEVEQLAVDAAIIDAGVSEEAVATERTALPRWRIGCQQTRRPPAAGTAMRTSCSSGLVCCAPADADSPFTAAGAPGR
jgi:hypothetical protein